MLVAKELYKSYGAQEILHGVSLEVERGDFLSIMGESGSGKSTLLSLLAGLAAPDKGDVLLEGKSLFSLSDTGRAELRRTRLGFVYQSLNLLPTLTALENILLPLYLGGGVPADGEARAKELAEYLGIKRTLFAFPDEMSGGEQQRVAIARSLIYHPDFLMLDEPTGALDSATTAQVMELLREVNRELGVAVIQVTHSAAAAAYGKRTLVLCDGRFAQA